MPIVKLIGGSMDGEKVDVCEGVEILITSVKENGKYDQYIINLDAGFGYYVGERY